MKANRVSVLFTVLVFTAGIVLGSHPGLFAQSQDNQEISRLLKEAEEAYQNGNFNAAIEKYQKLIELFNSKKELAKVKQQLLQTMSNLALTYFTIRENEKAEKQLEDLLRINPNQELDAEIFPPKFLELFQKVQRGNLGKLSVSTVPAAADVFLNGVAIGKSPQSLEKCFKGAYELKIEMSGYRTVLKQVQVNPEAATLEAVTLEKIEKAAPVVEKKAEKPEAAVVQKKKKFPVLLVVLGGVAVVAAVVLLAGGKSQPVEKSFRVQNADRLDIDALRFTVKILNVSQSRIITRMKYSITLEHPDWTDLMITIHKKDNPAVWVAWNRGPKTGKETLEGETQAFNSIGTQGDWYVSVENIRLQKGALLTCALEFFYME